ncbi:GNAT family N-acetyltransferase (plasmid) [Halorussus limi]|uniref:GNAT family N-acetyltransferase n=1 Tax=Halorussus limi TaxID=2938695 RepID=A0A8U0I0G8_9EURY|nr:GNAT family protein [Halorussus limi]UPV76416.1 GNAT family N-acetyltransferase [Halorussus limi]
MFPDEIETERLRFVRLSRDTVPTAELYQHMRTGAPHMSEVSEYAMWDPHETPKDTHDFLVSVEERWDDREQATYAIFARDDSGDELVGTTNLDFDWDRRSAELGVWLRRRFWGRGYSGERAAALLELAFDRLDLELVGASHRTDNERSRRAIEKYVERFGGQHDGVLRDFFPRDGEVGDLHRYTISREQYRDATADRD